ncbi:hypothetical protein [Poseidonibacter lekithochrous]|uniref:hypothetical protein n=1 Tax=Poseidonibacter lekithochrous TaxID=1904463 RepID=UPI000D39BBE1|nr:hypothetical protein [Poseidonibacter lekithochrous]
MERQKLKQILLELYSDDSVKSILSGRMYPSYKMIIKLNSEHKIPYSAWADIKTYMSNCTKCSKSTQV